MDPEKANNLRAGYDRVAEEYSRRVFDELTHKPLDCQLLDRFANTVRGQGPVCDLGCGPGHVARYLHERQVNVFGIDISPAMVEQARKLNPGIKFQQGDMLKLDVEDEAWGAIAAFYSIINIPRDDVLPALSELNRVLRTGGLLLLAFHLGEETIHMEEWWGEDVSLDFNFFRPEEVEGYLKTAGFVVKEVIEREPYEGVEYPSRRAYIIGQKE
ncbi:MAG TPA: methyltransferase domain-containing protein [Blastocatellia bacterium]|jgi:SAM-dependent methyltransferase|nr:methyltransferase domain-containing protein [Blastocatellia bacterium]